MITSRSQNRHLCHDCSSPSIRHPARLARRRRNRRHVVRFMLGTVDLTALPSGSISFDARPARRLKPHTTTRRPVADEHVAPPARGSHLHGSTDEHDPLPQACSIHRRGQQISPPDYLHCPGNRQTNWTEKTLANRGMGNGEWTERER